MRHSIRRILRLTNTARARMGPAWSTGQPRSLHMRKC
jgi:hypothetical protein